MDRRACEEVSASRQTTNPISYMAHEPSNRLCSTALHQETSSISSHTTNPHNTVPSQTAEADQEQTLTSRRTRNSISDVDSRSRDETHNFGGRSSEEADDSEEDVWEDAVESEDTAEENPIGEQTDTANDEEKHAESSSSIGCRHYQRKCKLVAPCCGEVFWCRHCHNETKNADVNDPKKNHEIDRKKVTEIVCAVCEERQPCANLCRNCQTQFAKYHCSICNFWDDCGLAKKAFHCDDCGICRVGGRENYYHCPTCDCCYANELKNKHTCIESAMKNACPICLEDMFSSIKTVHILDQCGHCMHKECLVTLQCTPAASLQAIRCPICGKGISDNRVVWRSLERSIAANPLPDELRRRACISCNDCGTRSLTEWHVFGMKCGKCGGYNTTEIQPIAGVQLPNLEDLERDNQQTDDTRQTLGGAGEESSAVGQEIEQQSSAEQSATADATEDRQQSENAINDAT